MFSHSISPLIMGHQPPTTTIPRCYENHLRSRGRTWALDLGNGLEGQTNPQRQTMCFLAHMYIYNIYIINICVCDTDTYIAMIYSRQNPLHLSSCYQLSFFFGVGAILWVSSVLFGGHIAYSVLCAPLTKTQPLWPWLICICVFLYTFMSNYCMRSFLVNFHQFWK